MSPHPIGRLGMNVAATALIAIAVPGCARNPVSPDGTSATTSDLAAETAFCTDEINRLRATVDLPPLARSSEIEAFSVEAARVDGETHQPHKHFVDTNGGNGVSHAENELPWWRLSQWRSVHSVVRAGLSMEWAEGPGGSHYEIMAGPYGSLACGIAVRNGEVTVTQDFR